MGKLIYKILFHIFNAAGKYFSKIDFNSRYRNSIYTDYFYFLKSDLDLSIDFPDNNELAQKSSRLLRFFQICPLIKEINFYYPANRSFLIDLSNYYELQRDPELFKTLPVKSPSNELYFVYLLRMYFANIKNLKNGISGRNKKKWCYHLNRSKLSESAHEIKNLPFENYEKLLFKILEESNLDYLDKYKNALIEFFQKKEAGMSTGDIFNSTTFKHELVTLLPHIFCKLKPTYQPKNITEEMIYLHQLSWEIIGLSTQPYLARRDLNFIKQYKNIEYSLQNLSATHPTSEDKKQKILQAITEILNVVVMK